MEEEPCHRSHESSSNGSLTSTPLDNPSSSSSPSTSLLQAEEANSNDEEIRENHQNQQEQNSMSYHVNISIRNPSMDAMLLSDDVRSSIVVLVSFWLVASVTVALSICGSINLQLGPYCSRLIEINSVLMQSVKVEQIDKPKSGLMLYGFDEPPPLDVKINWTETYNASLPANFQKEWIFYLNEESQLDVSYSVKPSGAALFLVIAKGREGLIEWEEDPLFPNATLHWNIIYGSGHITQNISHSFTYYAALGNMNPQNVEVELNFTVNALVYNTTSTYQSCSLDNRCSLKLVLLKSKSAVLTTPGPREGVSNEEWFDVKVTFEPRWIIYFTGSGMVAVLILFALRLLNTFKTSEEISGFQQGFSERAPLLMPSKDDDDISSRGSSYESYSNEEEDLTMWLEGKSEREGKSNSDVQHLCVICFDASRDCFFLPCGHSAACFPCGTRIAAEACSCPICRRTLKKVRKIYTV